jgi:hypothetical protein
MIGLGLGYAICGVVLWPSIATAVQQEENRKVKLLGTAIGFSISALNTALTIIPLIAAQIRIAGKSFVPVELFYSSIGTIFLTKGFLGLYLDSF